MSKKDTLFAEKEGRFRPEWMFRQEWTLPKAINKTVKRPSSPLPSPPRRGRNAPSAYGNTCGWIGEINIYKSKHVTGESPLPWGRRFR
jgi:hypothetical protein